MKVTYVLLLIVVLLFIVNCKCENGDFVDDPPPPMSEAETQICNQQAENSNKFLLSTVPIFAKLGEERQMEELSLMLESIIPNVGSCPNTNDSPIWQKSAQSVHRPSTGPSGQLAPRAAPASGVAYLRHLILNLPFPAQPSASDNLSPKCDPSQADLIQVDHDNAVVTRITTCPYSLVATIPVATRPLQIEIAPDGLTALVTSFDNAINIIDLTTNKVTSTLRTGGINPNGIAITPDGSKVYVTNFQPAGASVVEYDLTTKQQIFSMSAPAYPQSAFISPDGSQLFVTFPYRDQVWILDTLTNTLAFTLQIRAPRGIVFNSKGTKAYIASTDIPDNSFSPGTVQEFDTTTFQVTHTYRVGVGPNDVAMLYGDHYLIVDNFEGKSISLIDVLRGGVTTLGVPGRPSGLSIVR